MRAFRLAIVLASAFSATISLAPITLAQEARVRADRPLPADPAVRAGTLANGVRYYVRENERPEERAEVRLVVKAGSILEEEDQLGLAHFVEHMAFNGTRHFARQELVDYLESIGMRFGPDLNAYTSFDETVYMLKVPTDSAELLATAFQILEDWADGLTLDHEEIDKERGVVIEEWRLGQGAAARIMEQQWPVLFKGSRYAERLPIGDKEILESFDYSALERFYRDWYRPDLMAVIAVGDFDGERIQGLIEKHFGGLHGPDSARPRPTYPVPDHSETLVSVATDEEVTFSSVSVYWKQPPREEGTVGTYRQSIVESLYNRMLNQRLFELTQRPDPPFLGAFSGSGRFIGARRFYILGAGVANNGIERGLETVLTEAERVARHGFTESELEREKRELLRAIEQAYAEREKTESETYASEYVRAFLYDEPFPGISYEYELHEELVPGVTLEEVNRLAREWLVDHNRVILVSAPEKEGVEVPDEEGLLAVFGAVEGSEVEAYEDEASDAPLVASPPATADILSRSTLEDLDVRVWELANGVRVLLKPTDFKDDEILVRAWSPGGSSLAADSDYVAAITAASVVTQGGVGEFSLVELQKALAGKAVRASPFITSLGEGVAGSASPSDVETLFQLIYLYFTAPRADSSAYLSLKSRIQSSLANRGSDPGSEYRDTIQVTMTRHHFRARPASVELYDEMDLEKSFAFYRDRFADASDFSFVIVGNFEPDSIEPLVRTYLGSLPATDRQETWRDEGIRPPEGVVTKEVHRGIEPKAQTQILFTGPFEWTRRNSYLIGSLADVMRIRLREVLREDLGGTYGVAVSGAGSRDPHPEYTVRISFGASPDRLKELTDVVFQQIDSLKRHGPTEEEIEKVTEQQRRDRETDLKENSFWLARLISSEIYDTDPSEILAYDELVDGLTVERVRLAAKRYLNTENYVEVSLYPENDGEKDEGR